MNIIPNLNLNRHPKDSKNLSLVNAYNVKVSNDESCITNEEAIKENPFIHNYLSTYYNVPYLLVGIIPCSNELIIIVKPSDTVTNADIFRYQEPLNGNTENMYCCYGGIGNSNRFKYQGGLIKGAFTYNVENSLIVAITEYNVPNVRIPLRTINLGNVDDPTVHNDFLLSNAKLALSPELKVPTVGNLNYVAGGAYKGWYYLFLRYKVTSVDYTQWHSIGVPIYVDSLEHYQIIRYVWNRETRFSVNPLNTLTAPGMSYEGFGNGCSDHFSNNSDIARETFKVDLSFLNTNSYEKYQIGIICASKTYTKAFKTSDISIADNSIIQNDKIVQQYTLDNKSLIEYNVQDLITDNFNYYNSKNIINYKNRLYISNYLEDNANDDSISEQLIKNIKVDLIIGGFRDYGLVYDTAMITADPPAKPTQFDTYSMTVIPLYKYLNINEDVIITVNTKTSKAGQFYIVSNNQTPGFAYVEHREYGGLGSVIKTNFGKPPAFSNVIITVPKANGEPEITKFYTGDVAINGGMQYTNTNINFRERRKESTLIAGEIYNFFVHFVNGYNHATNGYKLNNNTIWDTDTNPGVEIIPVPFNVKVGSNDFIYYAAMAVNTNVSKLDPNKINGYTIDLGFNRYYKNFTTSGGLSQLTNEVDLSELSAVTKSFVDHFSDYATDKFINIKWYQISYGPSTNRFGLFINNNGERLFKVPTVESFKVNWEGFPDEVEPFKTYNVHTLLRMSVGNIQIPEGYDGYYISYEKFEPQARATGMLTRNDFRSQDNILGSLQSTSNNRKSDKMFFYSGQYDISDNIKLDYNIMRIEAVNVFKKQDIPRWDYFQRNQNFNYVHDQNKPQVESYGLDVQKTYPIPDYKLAVADAIVDSRMGLGTALQIADAYNLFPTYTTTNETNDKLKLYRVTLLNTTRNIYMANSKQLVKLTDVYYRDENSPLNTKYSTGYINTGYNGHYTYDGVLVYENAGFTFNTVTNEVRQLVYNNLYYKGDVPSVTPHTYQNDQPFVAYVQFPVCTDIFFESKSFKNAPKGIIFATKPEQKDEDGNVITTAKFAPGSMVTPANSIDLFENRQGSADGFNPKLYVNYRTDLVSIEQFDKTIRRSAVIQDESRINGWRNFPIEGYKNITENKGKIVNLMGIGVVLLVHTEHSLFMFNTDNTLKTQDKDIQLLQPDAFEVDYKEVFTSDKGFGGLQDDKSWIVDQFGYIFYSEDTRRIYLFDNNQLDYIDEDIIQWLDKYKPFNVRMANDKDNKRILIKFNYIVAQQLRYQIVSYNYKIKSFISQHDYYFDEAFNTKTKLYLQCTNNHNGCSLHSFITDGSLYGSFDNILGYLGTPTVRRSQLRIIANNDFNIVKFLEFITYKITKYKNDTLLDFTNSPVEEYIEPFAGNELRVFNNQVDTGVLDINVNAEISKNPFGNFDKPYWDLGIWNYSYLRNRIQELPNGITADQMTRLFGNYFIIEFTISNTDGRRVDFEELNYSISAD